MKSTAQRSPGEGILSHGDDGFGGRLRASLKGKTASAIAKAVGVAPSTLHKYQQGAMPAADTAMRLARALGVEVNWLIEGEGPPSRAEALEDQGVVLLPVHDPHAFTEYGMGKPIEEIAVPRQLIGNARTTTGLWLTEMPTDALPSVAAEGQLILCRPPEQPLQDRKVYVLLLGGRTIVRRVFVRPEGLLLKGDDEADSITIRPDDIETIMPVGRVLGPIGLGPN
jgi:transcriptional regulator with XRE-family HTH domain